MLAIGHHLSPEVLLSRTWKRLRLRSASFWETCDRRATVDDAPGCYSAVLACMAGCVLVPDLAPYCVPRSRGFFLCRLRSTPFLDWLCPKGHHPSLQESYYFPWTETLAGDRPMRALIVCAIVITAAIGLSGCFHHAETVTQQPLKLG